MKKKRKIWPLILLTPLVLIAVVVGLFFLPKTVNVSYSEDDLQSYLSKGGIILNENSASAEDIFFGNYTAIGSRAVEGVVTSAEATAVLNAVAKSDGILTNIRIKFTGENTYEASANISDHLDAIYTTFPAVQDYKGWIDSTLKGRTIYGTGTLVKGEGDTFVSEFTSIYVGSIPLPVDQANDYGEYLGTKMNQIISTLPGFNMETFKIDAEGLHFKGTIPTEIRSSAP